MHEMGFWITPILLVSGVGLLVLSTSARYGQIHENLHKLLETKHEKSEVLLGHLQNRAELLVRALFSLYISIGLFALASLIGGVVSFWAWTEIAKFIVALLTCFGILCIVFAAFQLIKEAHIFLETVEEHGRVIKRTLLKSRVK
jgi:hypothetical protein